MDGPGRRRRCRLHHQLKQRHAQAGSIRDAWNAGAEPGGAHLKVSFTCVNLETAAHASWTLSSYIIVESKRIKKSSLVTYSVDDYSLA